MFKWQFTSVGHTAEPGIHPHWCSQITTHLATCRCPEGRVTLFRWLHTRPLPATHASVGYRRRNGGFLRRERLKQLLTRLHVAHVDAYHLQGDIVFGEERVVADLYPDSIADHTRRSRWISPQGS
jgi:hypothetical protein